MPIDPAVAIGAEIGEVSFAWTSSDVLLYHLALGAGPDELRYTYEQDLVVLPTFATVAANLRVFDPPAVSFPGVEIDLAKVLHGKQEITLHQSLMSRISSTSKHTAGFLRIIRIFIPSTEWAIMYRPSYT